MQPLTPLRRDHVLSCLACAVSSGSNMCFLCDGLVIITIITYELFVAMIDNLGLCLGPAVRHRIHKIVKVRAISPTDTTHYYRASIDIRTTRITKSNQSIRRMPTNALLRNLQDGVLSRLAKSRRTEWLHLWKLA